jgi:hypothetical protein
MLYDLFLICVGLIIGWNVLPQPEWVRNLYLKAKETVTQWFQQ